MYPKICICCGEGISEAGRDFSRNPNLCPSCSSLWDGMDEEGQGEPGRGQQPGAAPEEQVALGEPSGMPKVT
ncbi:MAG: hypothetical protein ABSF95_02450 [Verrucomicrobiota bacterium]|jgi:hypothetical protein